MRIALFADTHGNLPATQAVIAAIMQEHPDQIVCLGDVAMFGPRPRAVLSAIAALGCPVVMGNTDAWALDPIPAPESDETTQLYNAIEGWGAAQLTAADRALLRTFQLTVRVALGDGHSLLAYHGSPRSFHEGIDAATPDARLDEIFGDDTALICAGGHTHVALMRRHGRRAIVNPGSAGLPYVVRGDGTAYNPPWAEYAIIDYHSPADLRISLRRTPVDIQRIVETALASGMPMAEHWTADWSNT